MNKDYHIGAVRKLERVSRGLTPEAAVELLNGDFRKRTGVELGMTVERLLKFEETGDMAEFMAPPV